MRVTHGVFFCLIWMVVLSNACEHTKSRHHDLPNKEYSGDHVMIEYIAHASFLLTYDSTTLLLDPFADSVWISYAFPAAIQADAVFSTHPHYDHDGGIFRNLYPYWEGKLPFYQDPGMYSIGGFRIAGIEGKHSEPYGKEFGQRNTVFIYEAGGIRLAHWGDNGPITDSLADALTDIDVLFLPIDDTYHILKKDEIDEIIKTIRPAMVVPMHYRIEALEPTPGTPKNLGPIHAYFDDIKQVKWLDSNRLELKKDDISDDFEYVVFKHSPKVL